MKTITQERFRLSWDTQEDIYFSLIVWLKFKAEHNKYLKYCKNREKADYWKVKQIGLSNQTQ